MKLSHELGKIFEEEMNAVIQREIDDPDYLPQSDFENCEERAAAIVKDACVSVIKTLAVGIATHRQSDKHKEDHQAEITELSISLSPERMEIGERGWWDG